MDSSDVVALSDGELLLRLADDDEVAYRELFRRYEKVVLRVARAEARTAWDADEVAGAAMFELWRRRADVRLVAGTVGPWLLRVVHLVAKNHARGQRRYQRLLRRVPLDPCYPDHADEVAVTVDAELEVKRLAAALAALGPRESAVVKLCLVDELSMYEAARLLGVPEGTVKSRLSRARDSLRGALRQG